MGVWNGYGVEVVPLFPGVLGDIFERVGLRNNTGLGSGT